MKIDKKAYSSLSPEERKLVPRWFKKAHHRAAIISVDDDGTLIWHNGVWVDGIWKGGIWKGGIWKGGTQLGSRCRWRINHTDHTDHTERIICIGCKENTIEGWDKFFAENCEEEYDHPRSSPEFKLILEQYYWYKEHVLNLK